MIIDTEDLERALWDLAEEAHDGINVIIAHPRNWHPHARRSAVTLRRKLKEIDHLLEIAAIESFQK